MKPDKHKQKKQSEYKKKHGILNKTDHKEKHNAENDLHKNDDSAIADNEQGAFNEESNEFETLNDDEEVENGEDLSQILHDTANTLFQYQYGNKNSFFEEVGNYSDICEKYQDIVSVNPGTLSEILLGLPLYKRLDLEEDIFEPEDLLKMQAEANMHLKKPEIPSQDEVKFSIDDEKLFHSVNVKIETSKPIKTPAVNPKPISNEASINAKRHNQPLASTPQIKTDPINTVPPPINNLKTPTSKSKKTTIADLEDELDALLLL